MECGSHECPPDCPRLRPVKLTARVNRATTSNAIVVSASQPGKFNFGHA